MYFELQKKYQVKLMKCEQRLWTPENGWKIKLNNDISVPAQIVFAFGGRTALSYEARFNEIATLYPNAYVILCSTAGEILDTKIFDDTITLTAVYFEKSTIQMSQVKVSECENRFQAGRQLVDELLRDDLIHIFVLSDGQNVNGSELVQGLNSRLSGNIAITGGLAGDGALFQKTLVGIDEPPSEGNIVAIGFYGENLKIGYGSVGGWDTFGTPRKITRSLGNILYEIEGKPALELYKRFLGDDANGLPSSGLLFPLSLKMEDSEEPVVRTLLNIDENAQSITFAGDMPEGAIVRFMKANFDRLIAGASNAAQKTKIVSSIENADLAILVSCVGRKLVLNQRVEEEVEKVREILGKKTTLAGFYSYGEISPFATSDRCELHNQTMTITTFTEV